MDGAQTFPENQNVKNECFHCASQIFDIFAGIVYMKFVPNAQTNESTLDRAFDAQNDGL